MPAMEIRSPVPRGTPHNSASNSSKSASRTPIPFRLIGSEEMAVTSGMMEVMSQRVTLSVKAFAAKQNAAK